MLGRVTQGHKNLRGTWHREGWLAGPWSAHRLSELSQGCWEGGMVELDRVPRWLCHVLPTLSRPPQRVVLPRPRTPRSLSPSAGPPSLHQPPPPASGPWQGLFPRSGTFFLQIFPWLRPP